MHRQQYAHKCAYTQKSRFVWLYTLTQARVHVCVRAHTHTHSGASLVPGKSARCAIHGDLSNILGVPVSERFIATE